MVAKAIHPSMIHHLKGYESLIMLMSVAMVNCWLLGIILKNANLMRNITQVCDIPRNITQVDNVQNPRIYFISRRSWILHYAVYLRNAVANTRNNGSRFG